MIAFVSHTPDLSRGLLSHRLSDRRRFFVREADDMINSSFLGISIGRSTTIFLSHAPGNDEKSASCLGLQTTIVTMSLLAMVQCLACSTYFNTCLEPAIHSISRIFCPGLRSSHNQTFLLSPPNISTNLIVPPHQLSHALLPRQPPLPSCQQTLANIGTSLSS